MNAEEVVPMNRRGFFTTLMGAVMARVRPSDLYKITHREYAILLPWNSTPEEREMVRQIVLSGERQQGAIARAIFQDASQ